MKVTLMKEAGYAEALVGLSLSYDQLVEGMPEVAARLAHRPGGHNKFLESIIVWLDIIAPRYWWQQFDTYRHVTKQSQSTMHTLLRRPLTLDDFEHTIPHNTLDQLNYFIKQSAFELVKDILPEGFLQRRVVCTSYKTLRNMVGQRLTHRLKEWHTFIRCIMDQVGWPEFLYTPKDPASIPEVLGERYASYYINTYVNVKMYKKGGDIDASDS